jgi:hypothetical protein
MTSHAVFESTEFAFGIPLIVPPEDNIILSGLGAGNPLIFPRGLDIMEVTPGVIKQTSSGLPDRLPIQRRNDYSMVQSIHPGMKEMFADIYWQNPRPVPAPAPYHLQTNTRIRQSQNTYEDGVKKDQMAQDPEPRRRELLQTYQDMIERAERIGGAQQALILAEAQQFLLSHDPEVFNSVMSHLQPAIAAAAIPAAPPAPVAGPPALGAPPAPAAPVAPIPVLSIGGAPVVPPAPVLSIGGAPVVPPAPVSVAQRLRTTSPPFVVSNLTIKDYKEYLNDDRFTEDKSSPEIRQELLDVFLTRAKFVPLNRIQASKLLNNLPTIEDNAGPEDRLILENLRFLLIAMRKVDLTQASAKTPTHILSKIREHGNSVAGLARLKRKTFQQRLMSAGIRSSKY